MGAHMCFSTLLYCMGAAVAAAGIALGDALTSQTEAGAAYVQYVGVPKELLLCSRAPESLLATSPLPRCLGMGSCWSEVLCDHNRCQELPNSLSRSFAMLRMCKIASIQW